MKEFSKKIKVNHVYGIHARVAAKIVEISKKYNSEIFIIKNGKTGNTKSIIEILMLAIVNNEDIIIKAQGEDCVDAVEEIANFIIESTGNYL
ncbi:MAG: HPr family phosphocarrier protein [Proteobacteria bacterium]|nr:HPr family phosphocarrier protein [Pseudomonadota bacterium]